MTKNPIILSTGSLYNLPLEEFFAIVQETDFDGLELIIDDKPTAHDAKIIRSLIEKHNMPVYSIHSTMDSCSVFGQTAHSIIAGSINFADQIGAQGVVVHPYRRDNKEFEQEIINVLKQHKSQSNIKLFLENMTLREWTQKDKPFYDPRYLAQQHTPLCLDTSHLATSKLDIAAMVTAVSHQVGHVHFADSLIQADEQGYISDDHLPLGGGKLPLSSVTRILANANYAGAFCVELRPVTFQGQSTDEITSALNKIYEAARKLIV